MNPVEKYFTAEKNESLLFFAFGLLAIAVALYFLVKIKQPFYSGMSYPLMAVACIQIVVGGIVFFRSPLDLERVQHMVQNNTSEIKSGEIPRMEKVMKNFVLYKRIEIGLMLAGLLMFFFSPSLSTAAGIGFGLSVQSGFMLLLDLFAESRGHTYLAYLLSQ